MQHQGTQVLHTSRLTLRPFTAEDGKAMFANWASDPEVTRFLTWPTHQTVEVSSYVAGSWAEHTGEKSYYQWAIVPENGGEPIGSIGVVRQEEATLTAEIGYCIGRKWWHQGIMTEAAQAVISFLIEKVGFQRVEAQHDVNNPHSGAVMQKCGMTFEGIHRRAGKNNQGICDVAMYAILAEKLQPAP